MIPIRIRCFGRIIRVVSNLVVIAPIRFVDPDLNITCVGTWGKAACTCAEGDFQIIVSSSLSRVDLHECPLYIASANSRIVNIKLLRFIAINRVIIPQLYIAKGYCSISIVNNLQLRTELIISRVGITCPVLHYQISLCRNRHIDRLGLNLR
ncbi:hypothetical protein D3C78_1490160 [compost metagenome]